MEESVDRVWRKHVYVLIMSTGVQWLQLLLTIFVLVGILLFRNRLAVGLPLAVIFGIMVIFFCLWTLVHFNRGLRAGSPESNGDKSAVARREELLTKLSTPLKRLVRLISILSTLFVIASVIFTIAVARQWLWAPILMYYLFLIGWLAIEIVDWRNDQYILTEDRIIDIMQLPVIYERRTEAPLAMVQNATTYQKGIGAILNFGNVQVETAGQSQAVFFESVWRPREIQEEIFRYIDRMKQATRERERAAQASQTQRWIESYHTLAGGVRDIRYSESVSADESIHIQWKIVGPADRKYRTWMRWDTISRLSGGEYAERIRAEGKAWYQGGYEFDGIGEGLHHVRGFLPPPGQQNVYFRIVVWFEGDMPLHSSPEMIIVIREASRV